MPISTAMIWITNLVTFPFFYYIFYIAGAAQHVRFEILKCIFNKRYGAAYVFGAVF